MNAAGCDPVHFRESGDKEQRPASGSVRRSAQLPADIAAQGGIGLFVDMSAAGIDGAPNGAKDGLVRLGAGHVPGLGVQNEDLGAAFQGSRIRHRPDGYRRFRSAGGKLHAGVKSAGKIICDNKKFQQVFLDLQSFRMLLQ